MNEIDKGRRIDIGDDDDMDEVDVSAQLYESYKPE